MVGDRLWQLATIEIGDRVLSPPGARGTLAHSGAGRIEVELVVPPGDPDGLVSGRFVGVVSMVDPAAADADADAGADSGEHAVPLGLEPRLAAGQLLLRVRTTSGKVATLAWQEPCGEATEAG